MNNNPLVSIVTVNYNHSEDTLLMIKSLKQCSYKNIEIIVVDNGSFNDNVSSISTEYPDVKLIILPHNLGFAGGNNEGFRHAQGEYVLLLNNDTEVDPNFLEPLVSVFQNNKNVGMASPKLLYFHSPEMKTIQYAGSEDINIYTGRGKNIGMGEIDNGEYNQVRQTDSVHGAALLVSKKVLTEVGCMPDVFFLYYEEHDWCSAMKRKGFIAYYVGTSRVFHKESVSVGKNSPVKTYYMARNRVVYLRRNAKGLSFFLAILFFLSFSAPMAIFRLMRSKDFRLIPYYISAINWNFFHYSNLKGFPVLKPKMNDIPDLVGVSNQHLAHSKFVKSIN